MAGISRRIVRGPGSGEHTSMAIKAFDNPVVTKELRSRMRGSRAYWVLFIYLSILAVTLFLSYLSWWTTHNSNIQGGGASVSFTAGRTFFLTLFAVQAVLISLIMPALTSGAISIEREQRTFDLLRSTTLPTRSIVLGKLFSSLSFVCLLLTASLPLISICFLLGGVSPQQVGVTYLLLLLNAVVYGAVAMAWSAGTGSTATATALSYASLFLYFCLTAPFAAYGVFRAAAGSQQLSLSALNPVGAIVGADTETYYRWQLPAWLPALLINGLLIVLMLVLAGMRLSDNPRRRMPIVRGILFVFLACTLFFIDGSPVFSMVPSSTALTLTLLGLVALTLFAPPFVTGDLRDPHEAVVEEPYWRRALLGYDLSAGVPTALTLSLLIGGVTTFSLSLWRSTFRVTSLSGDVAIGATILLVCIALGMAGFGKFLSVALRNRWAAMMMLYLLTAMLMILPYISYSSQTYAPYYSQPYTGMRGPSFSDNWLYFCPLVSLQQLCYDSNGGGFSLVAAQPYLCANSIAPDYVVCSALYLAIGIFGFGLARLVEKRRASAPVKAKKPAA